MAYDEKLAGRIRKALSTQSIVEGKKMMGGLTFMVNGKMCVGVFHERVMARIGPQAYEAALKRPGCGTMEFTGRPMKGFVFISPADAENGTDLRSWIDLALDCNVKAKPTWKGARTTKRATKRSGKPARS